MNTVQIQMIDHNVNSEWWKKIIKHFVKPGDEFEIRCWNEEHKEIEKAMTYGCITKIESNLETSIKGVVTEQMIEDILSTPELIEKENYNKMTVFFTIIIKNKISSEHYGTEVYLFNLSNDEIEVLKNILVSDGVIFSILIEEQNYNNTLMQLYFLH